MIAFFGTGLLGSGFVRALRRRGEDVNVWNRTLSKARALEADGARAFSEPAEAVRGAKRVHLTLSDDAAVDEVLERARPGMERDVILVDHTTTSPSGTAARAARWPMVASRSSTPRCSWDRRTRWRALASCWLRATAPSSTRWLRRSAR